jgi:hypothetical protein
MWSSRMAASVTVMLTSRQQCSSKSTPSGIASTHQASHCSRSFTGPPASPLSLALASCCYSSIAQHPTGTPARNHRATARKTSQLAVTWLLKPACCGRSFTGIYLTHPALEIRFFLGPTKPHRLPLSLSLPACSSVYSINRNRLLL